MIVRDATAGDAQAIVDIQNPLIRDTSVTFNSQEKTVADIETEIRELPCFMVVESDGTVLGFGSYFPFRRGVGYGRTMEHTIALGADARGRGAGRALMTGLEDHARRAGVGSLWAGVSGENRAGVLFHASLGFEEIARLPKVGFKFGRWMDLILMRKWLQDEPG